MTNIENIDMANRSELACIFASQKWCEGCPLDLCGTKECVDHIETWMSMECEAKDNPPAGNVAEPPQEAPADKNVDLQKAANEVTHDSVSHPAHYTSGQIEVIDFIEDKELGFHLGNAVKYISRAGRKDADKTVEDLRKAAWYLSRQIERLEGGLSGQNS